jgi:hypothetical protein
MLKRSAGTIAFLFGFIGIAHAGEKLVSTVAVTGDSHIYFVWDGSGNCVALEVASFSWYGPKQP